MHGSLPCPQAVTIRLAGDEASDFLNFVVKDEESGAWYDFNGTNFQVPLRAPPMVSAPMPTAMPNGSTNGKAAAAADLPPLLALDQIPQVSQVGGVLPGGNVLNEEAALLPGRRSLALCWLGP